MCGVSVLSATVFHRRVREGGSWLVRISLAQVGRWLVERGQVHRQRLLGAPEAVGVGQRGNDVGPADRVGAVDGPAQRGEGAVERRPLDPRGGVGLELEAAATEGVSRDLDARIEQTRPDSIALADLLAAPALA